MDSYRESLTGNMVTETPDFDGGRQVTVYVPPDLPQSIVFSGDGQGTAKWARALERAELAPTMIVGLHGLTDEMARIYEYSPNFMPDKFAAHERFVVEDVRSWVATRFGVALPPQRTAVFGVSAGGELALALGLRHPDLFGAVLCASPGGGYRPPGDMQKLLPRTYLIGGTEESFFLDNAKRWADALQEAGGDVAMHERPGAHGGAFRLEEFPLMIAWAFGG